ncbi:MAG: ATP-binding protein [Chloroflexota bacterium]|nr:MAG: ATP-binding protein [Chloroflexota bacterium]
MFHLLDPFYRSKTAKRAEGLGLVPYIAPLIMESHAGRLWIDSESGKGSTCSFTLPLVKA